MNLAFICFTCQRDESLLPYHYALIKSACPDAPVVYCIDKAEHVTIPDGAVDLITDFPRQGNLCGRSCHVGMLEAMSTVLASTKADYVVKIDSDVAFLSAAWIKPGLDMQGYAPIDNYYCKGTCYAMSARAVGRVKDYIKSPSYNDLNGRVEDGTITMAAAITSEPYQVRIYNPIDGDKISNVIFYHNFYGNPELLKNVNSFIDCGDRKYLELYSRGGVEVEAKKQALACVYSVRGGQKTTPRA